MLQKTIGLYIHTPFCTSKCQYCDFYSKVCDKKTKTRYTKGLCKLICEYSEQLQGMLVDSLYFGGGTPLVLESNNLLSVIKLIRKKMTISKRTEWTIEVNPTSARLNILKKLAKYGINRISIGAQSFVDSELLALGRTHSSKDIENTVKMLREVKISNYSLDLMFGIPDQTPESFRYSLQCAIALEPTHISCYGLTLEEGTPFYEKRDTLPIADEEGQRSMYFEALQILEKAGYKQYEISNFAKRGFECKHNLKYWNCDQYLGLGAAAHSYFGNKRFSFIKDIDMFCRYSKESVDLIEEITEVPPNDMVAEYVMLKFRLNEGIQTHEFSKRFGRDFEELFGDKIKRFIESGHIIKELNRYYFSTDGMYISNYILSEILDFS